MLKLIGKLSDKSQREKIGKKFAEMLGVEDLVIFVKDAQLDILLPAPGFPQTLPDGVKWRAFLEKCLKQKKYTGVLPFPEKSTFKKARAIIYKKDLAIVLLGGNVKEQEVQKLTQVLPLLASVFLYEQGELQTNASLTLAEKSLIEHKEIVYKLNNARRELQSALLRTEKEIAFRKRAETKLARANAEIASEQKRLNNLLMQAPAIIAVLRGPNHVYELANPLYMQLIGQRSLIGKTVRKALPELKGQGIYELLDDVYTSGKPFNGDEVFVKLDRLGNGTLEDGYFNFVYQPSYNKSGKVDGILVHAVEVTEQVAARKKVEESEEKFRTLADNMPTLAWMANADGYIFWYNSRWYEYSGTTPEQMKGWGWKSIHDPSILPHVLKKWQEAITRGKAFEMVFPLKGADGVFRPFLTRIIPINDKKGEIIRWFGTNTDITMQKELERQKDDFLGIASHELKTPVTSIKAYGQVLQSIFKRKGDIKAVEQLGKMDAQINKLTNLIEDLLDVTKIQSGRLEFHEDYFDFNELVVELVEELQITTEHHQILVDLAKTKSIYADRERIGQVLSNLITNAIKYSPHSKKVILRTALNKDKVTLCVEDFGVGISKDKQDKVFEQFFRVSGPTQSTFPGLGLGLYVSAEIIKREGGRIWVESTEGKGSTFCFNLPLKKQKVMNQKNDLVDTEMQLE